MTDRDESSEHDPVARARALAPLIREHADDSERNRRLSKPVVEAFCGAELYRVAVPRSVGGLETTPRVQIECIEAASQADGAAGWNLMIGIETFSLVGLAFDRDLDLFTDPLTIVCGSTANVGRAERTEGGYRVSGQWSFVSGCHNSHVFTGLVAVTDNGEPVAGRPVVHAAVPRGEFEIVDTWTVSGLRGSGSHDVRVDDIFVPERHLGRGLGQPDRDKLAESPVLRIPLGHSLL